MAPLIIPAIVIALIGGLLGYSLGWIPLVIISLFGVSGIQKLGKTESGIAGAFVGLALILFLAAMWIVVLLTVAIDINWIEVWQTVKPALFNK